MNTTQIPSHNHTVQCQDAQGTLGTPVNNFLAADRAGADDVYESSSDALMHSAMINPTGGSQSHENRSPYLGLNYIIALQGIYPSRN